MVKTTVENRTLNLPRNQDSKPNNYVSPKFMCPNIMKLH